MQNNRRGKPINTYTLKFKKSTIEFHAQKAFDSNTERFQSL